MNAKPLHIAIDGPVASGKGEVAARLASQYGLLYIYTGAMYRALALFCIRSNVDLKDEGKVVHVLDGLRFEFSPPTGGSPYPYALSVNGEDVTGRIFHQDTAQGASDVGAIRSVRKRMVVIQQSLAKDKRVVMEGRDIALRVLPGAELKIYLTASVEERARRRFVQWQRMGKDVTYEQTLEETKIRDNQDMTRATDPLQKVPDAWEIDTTGKSVLEVMMMIGEELRNRSLV